MMHHSTQDENSPSKAGARRPYQAPRLILPSEDIAPEGKLIPDPVEGFVATFPKGVS